MKANRPLPRVPLAIAALTLVVLAAGSWLLSRAQASTNQTAMSAHPRGVTVVSAEAASYRPSRIYVGTIEPWVSAKVGPQLVAAYVDSVLVRPGAMVKRNDVLATLDCRNASATSRAVTMQARALETSQAALERESGRITQMLDGGFVSANEAELKAADSSSRQAQLLALQAQMLGTDLQVRDCVLRAPFDGEVAERSADPGAFVRPGGSLLTLVDRTMVRVSADVPEDDFDAVAPGTEVKVRPLSTHQALTATVSRRAPSADESTRTVHIELDLPNADRRLPVGTTAELQVEVGQALPAARLPMSAATVKGSKAQVYVVEQGIAHAQTLAWLGESLGMLFVEPKLAAGSQVVSEGRAQLKDGDAVAVQGSITGPTGAAR